MTNVRTMLVFVLVLISVRWGQAEVKNLHERRLEILMESKVDQKLAEFEKAIISGIETKLESFGNIDQELEVLKKDLGGKIRELKANMTGKAEKLQETTDEKIKNHESRLTDVEFKEKNMNEKVDKLEETMDEKIKDHESRLADVERRAERHLVNRFQGIQTVPKSNAWIYTRVRVDAIQFKVNRRIIVVGVGLYGCYSGSSSYSVKMKIFNSASSSSVSLTSTSYTCDGTTTPFQVMFDEPAVINPDTVYTISCLIKGATSYYGEKGQSKVVVNIANQGQFIFSYSNSPDDHNGSDVNGGTIPVIIFQA